MFSGLDSDTNPKNFYESVLQIANRVNPNVIVDCVKMLEFGQPNQRAIVEFKDDSHCCLVFALLYEFLNSPRYRGRFKNKKQEIIRISYALDSSRMEDSGWVAVVIRNLPKECNKSVIVANCSSGGEKIPKVLYATNPIKVKDMECCIVRVKTIEDAEQICRRLNKRRKDKEGVFVDIHPNSNYKRNYFMKTPVNPDASLFNIFKLEHYFPGNMEGKKVRARDEVAEYNKQIIEKHLKESNVNTPLVGLNCTDIESLKKTLDNVSESTIRNNKIISLLSEITSQEKVQHIDIVESAPPLRKVHVK